jgi:hypothetical protein
LARILEKANEGKVSVLSFEPNELNPMTITMFDENCVIIFRYKVELVQFVGWLLNQLHTEITARNQMFGHLELLV